MQDSNPQALESIARDLTELFIRERHSDEIPHLAFILDQLTKYPAGGGPAASNRGAALELLARGLPFEGEETVKLVTPAAFLILEGTVQRLRQIPAVPPLVEIQLVLKETAQRAGASESLAKGLADVVGAELHARLLRLREVATHATRKDGRILSEQPPGTHLVWSLLRKDEISQTPKAVAWRDVQTKYNTAAFRSRCDIFIYLDSVLIGSGERKHSLDDLETREYRLLLMFLINRGACLNPAWLHLNAWTKPYNYEIRTEKDAVPYLKVAVTHLRKQVAFWVRDFVIKKKERGYICAGEFSACVILPETTGQQFIWKGS